MLQGYTYTYGTLTLIKTLRQLTYHYRADLASQLPVGKLEEEAVRETGRSRCSYENVCRQRLKDGNQ